MDLIENNNDDDFNFVGGNNHSVSKSSYHSNARLPHVNKNVFDSTPVNPNHMIKINMGIKGDMYSFERTNKSTKRFLRMGDRNRAHALNMIANV